MVINLPARCWYILDHLNMWYHYTCTGESYNVTTNCTSSLPYQRFPISLQKHWQKAFYMTPLVTQNRIIEFSIKSIQVKDSNIKIPFHLSTLMHVYNLHHQSCNVSRYLSNTIYLSTKLPEGMPLFFFQRKYRNHLWNNERIIFE